MKRSDLITHNLQTTPLSLLASSSQKSTTRTKTIDILCKEIIFKIYSYLTFIDQFEATRSIKYLEETILTAPNQITEDLGFHINFFKKIFTDQLRKGERPLFCPHSLSNDFKNRLVQNLEKNKTFGKRTNWLVEDFFRIAYEQKEARWVYHCMKTGNISQVHAFKTICIGRSSLRDLYSTKVKRLILKMTSKETLEKINDQESLVCLSQEAFRNKDLSLAIDCLDLTSETCIQEIIYANYLQLQHIEEKSEYRKFFYFTLEHKKFNAPFFFSDVVFKIKDLIIEGDKLYEIGRLWRLALDLQCFVYRKSDDLFLFEKHLYPLIPERDWVAHITNLLYNFRMSGFDDHSTKIACFFLNYLNKKKVDLGDRILPNFWKMTIEKNLSPTKRPEVWYILCFARLQKIDWAKNSILYQEIIAWSQKNERPTPWSLLQKRN